MSGNMKERLRPCVHAIAPGYKVTPPCDLSSALASCLVKSKHDKGHSILNLLDESRRKLVFQSSERSYGIPASFNLEEFLQDVTTYLSLVKGFHCSSGVSSSANITNEVQSTAVTISSSDGDVGGGGSGKVQSPSAKNMAEPLLDEKAPKSHETTKAKKSTGTLSELLRVTEWSDICQNQMFFAVNSRVEYAQTLLGAGVALMNYGKSKVDKLLGDRDINEEQLKLAYRAFLSASGILEACCRALGHEPKPIGAKVATASAVEETMEEGGESIPSESEMEKWRKEQAGLAVEPVLETSENAPANPEFDRIADLMGAEIPQVLAWISLAQAQELTIFRASTNENHHDFLLISKLCMDTHDRYKECFGLLKEERRTKDIQFVKKFQTFTNFKSKYYLALSTYYQGAAQYDKDDGEGCVKAVANFDKGKKQIEDCCPIQEMYVATLGKDERGRREEILKLSWQRSLQIFERDLDIATNKNRTVYYENIPEPDTPVAPTALVKATAFPPVSAHESWKSGGYEAFDNSKSPSAKKSSSLCCGCVIS